MVNVREGIHSITTPSGEYRSLLMGWVSDGKVATWREWWPKGSHCETPSGPDGFFLNLPWFLMGVKIYIEGAEVVPMRRKG
jgi:hypothetical protein